MSTQLLIYQTAVPVSAARHGRCAVESRNVYAFTKSVNCVPLMAIEFPLAAPEYAIVFAVNGDDVMPVVILGARPSENLFLNSEDQWQAKYIPAFIRRYPFVFSVSEDSKSFTLCVDEAYPGFNFQGKGNALFELDGKPSAYTDTVLKFLQEYRAQFIRTQAACRTLKDLDLLSPMQAQVTSGVGEKLAMGGFAAVDRKKLKAISKEDLARLFENDELELIYLHLHSLGNFAKLVDRLHAWDAANRKGPEVAGESTPKVSGNGAHAPGG